jgi:site-specific recombinase
MQLKAIAFVIIVGFSIALFVALRTENRADAAAGNCYSDAKGPSAPTICN